MTTSVKVGTKYQIVIPRVARKKLKIKQGDRLLVDAQDGIIVLIPQPKRYAEHLQGLHASIWESVDVQKYLNGERGAWTSSASA